jgi:K+/H+ antiporter YhaU regulatory subunit KhtT
MDHFDRLDRIEILLEKIGQRVDSNAKAIEAISAYTTEYQKDRAQMYQLMADLAQTQADLAQAQAEGKREMYRMLGNLDQQQAQFSQQQAEIVQILKLLVQQKKDEAI